MGGVLHMFESVAHELYSPKPPGDANDAVTHLLFLHYSQYDHPRTGLAVVRLGLVDESILADARSPGVVGGLCVLFVLL